jgi:hypothetical protein
MMKGFCFVTSITGLNRHNSIIEVGRKGRRGRTTMIMMVSATNSIVK